MAPNIQASSRKLLHRQKTSLPHPTYLWAVTSPACDTTCLGPPHSGVPTQTFLFCRGLPVLDVERPHLPPSLPLLRARECAPFALWACQSHGWELVMPRSRLRWCSGHHTGPRRLLQPSDTDARGRETLSVKTEPFLSSTTQLVGWGGLGVVLSNAQVMCKIHPRDWLQEPFPNPLDLQLLSCC